MGAIAGIVYPDLFPVSYAVNPMLEVMAHRDPAEAAVHQYRNLELGARGPHFSFDPQRPCWVVLDGLIYNALDLHKELVRKGYNLPTPLNVLHVITEAYHCWGPQFVDRLNGPFALALFDIHNHKLLLSRSRIGRKPLYWAQHHGYFLFASELKAILASNLVPQEPSPEVLAPYLFFGYLTQDDAPIQSVNKLLPGTVLQLSEEGAVSIQSYWNYGDDFLHKEKRSDEEVAQILDGHLQRIIKERLQPERSTAYFSRGGVGAASLGYYLKEPAQPHHITALSTPLKGEDPTALERALYISHRLEQPIYTRVLSPEVLFEDLVKMVWVLDEPIADPETVMTWHMFKLAKQHSQSVFSAAGCNEILAGSMRYVVTERRMTLERYLSQLPQRFLRRVVLPLLRTLHKRSALNVLRHLQVDPWQVEYLLSNTLFGETEIPLVAPRLGGYFDPSLFLQRFPELRALGSTMAAFLFLDGKTVLPDRLIPQYDRFGPAHGIECVTPFLDRFLVAFLASVPEEQKISGGVTARPLQQILAARFPDLTFSHPTPHTLLPLSWLQEPQVMEVFQLLSRGALVDSGWISGPWIRSALSRRQLSAETFRKLWGILILEIWFRLYIYEPISFTPPDLPLLEFLRR